MRPASLSYIVDRPHTDAVSSGQYVSIFGRSANGLHHFFVQLRQTRPFATGATTFGDHIGAVIACISKVQMFLGATRRVIANVADVLTRRNWPIGQFPHGTVRINDAAIASDLSIAFGTPGSGPFSTARFGVVREFGPQPFFKRQSHVGSIALPSLE